MTSDTIPGTVVVSHQDTSRLVSSRSDYDNTPTTLGKFVFLYNEVEIRNKNDPILQSNYKLSYYSTTPMDTQTTTDSKRLSRQAYLKAYYRANREQRLAYQKEYNRINKDRISRQVSAKRKSDPPVECVVCGVAIRPRNMNRHLKSKKHATNYSRIYDLHYEEQ